MTEAPIDAQDIVVEEVLPHALEAIWKTLTTGELIDRWLMKSTGFQAVKGAWFTFQTRPAGAWDGVVHCQVLEVTPNERLSYSWKGGHDGNLHYGSRIDTIVTWTLAEVDGGTLLRLVHSGFALPENDTAYRNLGEGWKKVFNKISRITTEDHC
jgi:uncharacterized protein YndB with AHSA1/START domain